MDCKQAEVAMLKHMERAITPQDAVRLSQHVMVCEHCREHYLMFDQVMEFAATSEDWDEAPPNFTSAVMAKVAANVAIKPAPQAANKIRLAFHVTFGLCAVFFATILFFAYNPTLVSNLTDMSPAFAGLVAAIHGLGTLFGNMMESFIQTAGTLNIANSLSIAALVFVLVLSSLLIVLHKQDEKGIA